jgi:toxin ParE1/3/4
MSQYRLSQKAVDDLLSIYNYTYHQFGELQADTYLLGIEEKITDLAASPELAFSVNDIRVGYRRAFFQKHAIYFKEEKRGILIVRVLHQQMRANLHFS